MAKSYLRGHLIHFEKNKWVYSDNGEPTVDNQRDCGFCKMKNREDDHDSCIENLPGVLNACCGHGIVSESYIQFKNGITVRGFRID